jgi:hypothetical protein
VFKVPVVLQPLCQLRILEKFRIFHKSKDVQGGYGRWCHTLLYAWHTREPSLAGNLQAMSVNTRTTFHAA